MKRINSILLIVGLLGSGIIPASLQAQEIGKGHQLMQAGDYGAAKEIYLSLQTQGKISVALYYNLGIACYELEQYPESILYFEKALKLDPGHRPSQHNLRLANRQIDNEFIEVPDFFLLRWWKTISLSLPLWVWTLFFFLSLVLIVMAFYLYQLSGHPDRTRLGKKLFYPLVILALIIFIAGISRHTQLSNMAGAIIMDQTGIYEGPDKRSEQLYELVPGTRVKILDRIGDWIKVELINKEQGWIPEQAAGKI